ncbi:MAG TPA: hypothetical protein VFL98_03160 [Candidatus Paceibacterota bacterium]|nr:hypothetical protein [Candidatus Paceibacterota bacterium]
MATIDFQKQFPAVFAALSESLRFLEYPQQSGWVFVRSIGDSPVQYWANIPLAMASRLDRTAKPPAAECIEAAGCRWALRLASKRFPAEYAVALMAVALYRSGAITLQKTRDHIERVPAPLDWRRVRLYAVLEEPELDPVLDALGSRT